ILFGIVYLWLGDVGLGLLLLTTLVSVSLTSALMGTVIPLVLNRTRIDPAIATGPFITVLSDIIGLVIYLAYATFYLA
ncbi:MAG: magnesium transporter, partial [bacterium]|nr:magnesium transporter [bacterium]